MIPKPGSSVLTDSNPPKVLLVDDEATGRRLLRRWIERGFDAKVVEADNGLEALEALAAEEFDLIVLDLMMPVLDGTETLSLIRSDPNYGDTEVVVATQLASEQKVRDIISLGVADYILKPLRYDSVVDRLHQIVNGARQKKKDRERHSNLQTVLVADPDPNFCDFAVSALSGRFHGVAVRTAAEALVGVLKNEPTLIMLSPKLPGLPFEMLGKKVVALAEARQGKVCLITESRAENIDETFSGQVVRTFVPENFVAEVAKLIAGAATVGGEEPWLNALEPEITSAVRQALGMMTGYEPSTVEGLPGDAPDLFGIIHLKAESGEFDLIVHVRCRRSFAVALCNAMLGTDETDADNEFLMSGVGEILNVVGGRIKNSCHNRKIDVLLGLPQLLDEGSLKMDSFYRWEQAFVWKEEHSFALGLSGTAGSVRPDAEKSSGGVAASTPSAQKSAEAPAEGEAATAAPDGAGTEQPQPAGEGTQAAEEARPPDDPPQQSGEQTAASDAATDAASTPEIATDSPAETPPAEEAPAEAVEAEQAAQQGN